MLVTIFSDASHCGQTNAAGWGAWAKSERGQCQHGEAFKVPMPNSSLAESAAVVRAIDMALAGKVALPGDSLIVQTDALSAITFLGLTAKDLADRVAHPQSRRYTELHRVVHAAYLELAVQFVKVEFRHVKGHGGGGNPRSWVNELCDRLAGRAMRGARKRDHGVGGGGSARRRPGYKTGAMANVDAGKVWGGEVD